MADPQTVTRRDPDDRGELALLTFGSLLLHWRRVLGWLGGSGAVLGLVASLLTSRPYKSTATFIPQGSEAAVSGLAIAASQLGIRVPTSGGVWGPAVYVALLRSGTLLGPIATDTVVVVEEEGRSAALADLLEVDTGTPAERVERAIRELKRHVAVNEDQKLGAVQLSVTTRWASVSYVVAQRLVSAVNEFNVTTRKSQAAAERQFVEDRAGEAERALRAAEDRLQSFLQRNRAVSGAPQLAFERERMEREVSLRQQVYTSLVQSREDARIREVRDTPVITLIDAPELPAIGEARHTVAKAALGGVAGVMFGTLIALFARYMGTVRAMPDAESREFVQLLESAVPKLFRRGRR